MTPILSPRPHNSLSNDEYKLIYLALRANDGGSLRPDWDSERKANLTRALDVLRLQLLDVIEP